MMQMLSWSCCRKNICLALEITKNETDDNDSSGIPDVQQPLVAE